MTSGKVVTTIGYERRFNPSLSFDSLESFVGYMLQDQPPRPANMANIVAINQGRKPCSMRLPVVPRLTPKEARIAIEAGSMVLDTRHHEAFGACHIPGAYNAEQTSGSFEQNVGWIMPVDQPFLLVVEDPRDVAAAMNKLAFVGLDGRVAGTVEMNSWREAGMPCARVSQIDVQALQARLGKGEIQLLDVRESSEWDASRIDSARYTNFKHLLLSTDRLPVVPDREVAVICAGGMRSSTACSILQRLGFGGVYNVRGGMNAWHAAGLPVASP